jgi:hypothetical protein
VLYADKSLMSPRLHPRLCGHCELTSKSPMGLEIT